MSERTQRDHEVVFSMEVGNYFEFIDQAEIIASAGSRPIVRPPANAPILSVEVDEIAEFSQKAGPARNPTPSGDEPHRESA